MRKMANSRPTPLNGVQKKAGPVGRSGLVGPKGPVGRSGLVFGIPRAEVDFSNIFALKFSRGGSTFVWAGGAWRNVNYLDRVYVHPRPKLVGEPVLQRLLKQIAEAK